MTWKSLLFNLSTFQKTAIITVCVTFLLIFIGGLVRASGAGLGCPDWPRCFGLWIPPLSAADLPGSYDPEQFNVFKTWMEYVNRLVGVLVGILILMTFTMSIRRARTSPSVFAGAAAAAVLVLFQGWLGGQVVRSGLESWMISVHMVVAIVIINTLLLTIFLSMRDRIRFTLDPRARHILVTVLGLLLVVIIVQVVLGTQVREGIETVKSVYPELVRSRWIEEVGIIDQIHRSFSIVVLILVAAFSIMVWKIESGPFLPLTALLTIAGTMLQISLGIGLVYFGFPPAFQLLHLWIAAFVTAVPFLALLFVLHARVDITADQ